MASGGFDVVPPNLLQYAQDVQAGKFAKQDGHIPADSPLLQPDRLLAHVKRCRPQYVANTSARRFCLQMAMCDEIIKGGTYSEAMATEVENEWADVKGDSMVTLALTNVQPLAALSRVSKYLSSLRIDISRVQLDVIQGQPDVTMLRILTTAFKDPHTGITTSWSDLSADGAGYDLARASKWVDDRVLTVFKSNLQQKSQKIKTTEISRVRSPEKSLIYTEATVALSDLTHALLSPSDPYQYARSRVLWVITSPGPARDCAADMITYFCSKFSKRFREEHGAVPYDSLQMHQKINAKVELPMMRAILEKLQDVVEGVVRTNLENESRFALSMRLDPVKCTPTKQQGDSSDRELPFGVFFVSGRRFSGFHIRFRDIARGGLRLVTPFSDELRSMETSRHYFECYDLAFAQQLKNKDIAEGGAKAVVICDAVGLTSKGKNRAMRRSARAFVDSTLDLLAPQSNELLYFGPDEQIVPDDIDWISKRAIQRGYPLGSVVISSKAEAGINHKQYGVTSEGVNVFLEYALKEVGIDPRKHPFTIKITGGPDGDVAGNMLRIINRDYGENARVVGISDATGVAEDPKGLNWAELMRLVTEGKPLSDLDPSKGLTSSDGRFGKASEQEGLLMRNTMHLRVKSDAFVPAGGRPAAINANNWKAYLDPTTQQPSSSVIVEGANLFLTPQARKLLSQEAKCLIVKDSSANKCGVVTSSYEVLGGMILTQEQFLSVKEEYVRQVLQRLRYIARSEASLLMREWRSGRAPVLPDVCVGLSYAIIRVADAVETQVHDDDLLSFVASLLPLSPLLKALKIENPAQDDYLSVLKTRLPAAYLRGLVSKVVASECIYREGIEYFDAKKYADNAALGARAVEYIRAVERINGIVKDLRKEGKGEVADILKVSGPRAVMEFGKEIL
jgi:glutamate dehydrogenase